MATEILLTSEAFVKGFTSISDNVASKYIRSSIREAQEVGLRGILGDTLLDKLKADYAADQLADQYKTLVDKAQYYLAYLTIVGVAQKVSFKVANAGVVKTGDENVQNGDSLDVVAVQAYYQAMADSSCLQLQNYLLENIDQYPELSANDCNRIKSNLYSAATCGIWLGGARGKQL